MDAYSPLMTAPGTDQRFFGVTVGIVTNNKDPDGLGRVKATLPWMADQIETDWARVVTPMAGGSRGVYFLPEVDDEVLVAFEHGDPGSPYVLGGLWNGKDKPPESNSDGKNDLRTIKSRVAPLALARMVPDSHAHPSIPELAKSEELYRSAKVPVALVWGMKDPILGRVIGHLSRLRPDASVVKTGAGHFLQEEVPGELAAAIVDVAKRATW